MDMHTHTHTHIPLKAWREVKATHSTITDYKTEFTMASAFTLQKDSVTQS